MTATLRAGESPEPSTEGFAEVLGFRLFYRSFGRPDRGTVLGLHGGPGATHDYLLPFADLTHDGYRVVLFDLLGCGRSEVPSDHSLFSLAHNVEEVEGLRRSLRLGPVHLIGSSYGGLLAIAVTLEHPSSVRSLTTVGGLADVPFATAEMLRLKETLPEAIREVLHRHEAAGTVQSTEYLQAVEAFYRRFLCRIEPWPPEVQRSMEMTAQRPVYAEMNGPNEFTITGSIRDIDLSSRLPEIRTPTLVLGGRFDEVTPEVAKRIQGGIRGARRVEFERSSHLPFWEERNEFHRTVAEFLNSVEGTEGPG